MNKRINKKIAQLAVRTGVNLKAGQDAVIFISTRQRDLAYALVEECYLQGANKVSIEWSDEEITKLHYLHQSEKTLKKIERWERLKAKQRSERLPVLIHVDDDNPDAFDECDMDKIAHARASRAKAIKRYRDKEFLYNQWTIIAVPSKAWAQKVFPNDTPKVGQKKLLDAILKTTRLDQKDPLKAWDEHIKDLKARAEYLNNLNLDYVEYHSSNGTNLKVHLQKDHRWLSARSKSLQQIEYCANLPTEEVFTMPKRDGVDGVVVASKPLSYNGKVIEDFKLYLKEGRIYQVEARVNEDVLKKAIDTDEGSHHLGEIALVPFTSPINQTNILFYNTLFDENACCHFAFGQAFEDNMKGYENLSKEEMIKLGFNDSLIHVDFMVGTADLEIIGTDFNGGKHPIFKNGVWAF